MLNLWYYLLCSLLLFVYLMLYNVISCYLTNNNNCTWIHLHLSFWFFSSLKTVVQTSDFIIENLYLGPQSAAKNEQDLKSKNITHILAVMQRKTNNLFQNNRHHKTIMTLDSPSWDITQIFPEAFGFIDEARNNKCGVLVHWWVIK